MKEWRGRDVSALNELGQDVTESGSIWAAIRWAMASQDRMRLPGSGEFGSLSDRLGSLSPLSSLA